MIRSCLDSWEKFFPDYEIIRWDESNYNVQNHNFVRKAYADKKGWARKALINIANSGKFSSDRTIEEYVRDIWHLKKVVVEDSEIKNA